MIISQPTISKLLNQLNSEVNILQTSLNEVQFITQDLIQNLSTDNLPDYINSLLIDDEITFMLSYINKHKFQITVHQHYIDLSIFFYDKNNNVTTLTIRYVISADKTVMLINQYNYDDLSTSILKDLQYAHINLEYIKEHKHVHIGTITSIAKSINDILEFDDNELINLYTLYQY